MCDIFLISLPINYREVMFVAVVVGDVIAVATPGSILRLTHAVIIWQCKSGNVPERSDLYARGFNLIGGDY